MLRENDETNPIGLVWKKIGAFIDPLDAIPLLFVSMQVHASIRHLLQQNLRLW